MVKGDNIKVKITASERRIKFKTSQIGINKAKSRISERNIKNNNSKTKNTFINRNVVKGTAKVIVVSAKKQLNKELHKTKKKLNDTETFEGETISKFIDSTEKTVKTTISGIKAVKGTVKIAKKGYGKYKLGKETENLGKNERFKNAGSKKINLQKRNEAKAKRLKKFQHNLKIRNGTNNQKITNSNSNKEKIKRIVQNKYKLKIRSKNNVVRTLNASNNQEKFKRLNKSLYKLRIRNGKKTEKVSKKFYKKRLKTKTDFNKKGEKSTEDFNDFIQKRKKQRYEESKRKVSENDAFFNSKKQNNSSENHLSREKNKRLLGTSSSKDKINTKKKMIVSKKSHKETLKKQAKKNAVKTSKSVSKQMAKKATEQATRITTKIVQEIGKATASAIQAIASNPYVLAAIVVILLLIIAMTAMITPSLGVLEHTPNTDIDTLAYLMEKLVELDDEANYYLENIDEVENISCHNVDYEYIGSKNYVYSSPKEFIIMLMIITKNDHHISKEEGLQVFSQIHELSYKIEYELVQIVTGSGDDISTKRVLEVTLTTYSFDELMDILGFNELQKEEAYNIMQIPFEKIYKGLNFNEAGEGLTSEEIDEMLKNLPPSTPQREELRRVAFTLVDYTVYDWGGKASGSVAKPTGLDCSGFVAWVYDRAGVTNVLQGGGTTYQWGVSTEISYSQLQVGDLGFMKDPTTLTNQGNNHVGMYIGNGVWIECYSSHGVGVTDGNVFKYYRKVNALNE